VTRYGLNVLSLTNQHFFHRSDDYFCSHNTSNPWNSNMIFDSDIKEPEKVEEVKIDFSFFNKIVNGIGKHFPELMKLKIFGIKFVSYKNFADLENLKELNLHGNKDLEINYKAFANLRKIERLDLSDCQIKTLPNNCFDFQEKLKWLDIASNGLTVLNFGIFKFNEQLKFIRLSFNNFQTIDTANREFSHLKAIRFGINDKICNKTLNSKERNFLARSPSFDQFEIIIESKCSKTGELQG
jgi:Leucine-rich repeat (LRR) protein